MAVGFVEDDGGRAAAGFHGEAGDCVVRAIAIATQRPYREVYEAVGAAVRATPPTKRRKEKRSARDGVYKTTYHNFLLERGWRWTATMGIGTGCKVHLCAAELPAGRLICAVSKHLVAVIDGVIHDTYDPRRISWGPDLRKQTATRCVYGYYSKEGAA